MAPRWAGPGRAATGSRRSRPRRASSHRPQANRIPGSPAGDAPRLQKRARRERRRPGQKLLQQFAQAIVVVDDQQVAWVRGRRPWLRFTPQPPIAPICLTTPAALSTKACCCERKGLCPCSPTFDRRPWLDLARRPVPSLAGGEGARTDPRPLHYASAVFKGERMYGGGSLQRAEHLHPAVPFGPHPRFPEIPFTEAQIREATLAACAKNGLNRPPTSARSPGRRSESIGVSAQNSRIHVADNGVGLAELFQAGGEAPWHRTHLGEVQGRPLAGNRPDRAFKAAGRQYMICTLSKHAAEREGLRRRHDARCLAWLAGPRPGQCVRRQGRDPDPPTPDCFLDGITRRSVMALARSKGFEVVETPHPAGAGGLQRVLHCRLRRELTPVSRIGDYAPPGQHLHCR